VSEVASGLDPKIYDRSPPLTVAKRLFILQQMCLKILMTSAPYRNRIL